MDLWVMIPTGPKNQAARTIAGASERMASTFSNMLRSLKEGFTPQALNR